MPEQNRRKFVQREVVLSGGSGHPNFVTLQPHITDQTLLNIRRGITSKKRVSMGLRPNRGAPLRFGEAVICSSDAAGNVQDGFRQSRLMSANCGWDDLWEALA
jgi:hypothetical protein